MKGRWGIGSAVRVSHRIRVFAVADSQPNEKFVQLLTQHQNRIYTYILSLLGNPVDAHDVLQETNLVLWRKATEFELGTDFAAWAAVIAHYQVLYFRRRLSRDRLVFDEATVSQLAGAYVDTEDTPEREIALRACLDQLSPEDREAIAKRYAPDGSVKDLAGELGRTPVATSAYLMRLRRKLFECISQRMSAEGSE